MLFRSLTDFSQRKATGKWVVQPCCRSDDFDAGAAGNSSMRDQVISSEALTRSAINSLSPQYPVAIPEFEEFIHIKNEDGTRTTYKTADINVDEIEDIYGSTTSPYPLETISQRVSPHIQTGWIEIACVYNEESRYVYFQSLRIQSD